ncbi:MAG: asparagine--tRNA ligase [Candidatus Bathyarchaeia archaeon]
MSPIRDLRDAWRRSGQAIDVDSRMIGKKVILRGWVHRKRFHGGVLFIDLRDPTGTVQLTIHRDQVDEMVYREAERTTLESSITIEGVVRADRRAPGGVEVSVNDLKIVNLARPWPIQRTSGKIFLLDHRHLHLRSPKVRAVMLIRSAVIRAMREHLEGEGFIEVQPPILISVAVEGGATLFPIEYFGRGVYLTQSGQLYLEAAITSLGKVYGLNPSFRAEKSRTSRHLTEFWEVECEVPFATHEDIIKLEEDLLVRACSHVVEHCQKELKELGRKFEVPQAPFERITYDEAIEIASKMGERVKWGEEFGARTERVISEHFEEPFFVEGFPTISRSFYHKPNPKDAKVTLSSDMMAPGGYGELSSGGQRISDYELLVKRIREQHLPLEDYKWYLDLRKYGIPPHSGFGLGIERTVRWICALKHIREACLFPRTPDRVHP